MESVLSNLQICFLFKSKLERISKKIESQIFKYIRLIMKGEISICIYLKHIKCICIILHT